MSKYNYPQAVLSLGPTEQQTTVFFCFVCLFLEVSRLQQNFLPKKKRKKKKKREREIEIERKEPRQCFIRSRMCVNLERKDLLTQIA